MGELGVAGWAVRMGGSGGRALVVGLVMPEDNVSELAREACGFIGADSCYILRAECMAA